MHSRINTYSSFFWIKSLAFVLLLTMAGQQWVQIDASLSKADIEWEAGLEMDGEEGEEFENEADDKWLGQSGQWLARQQSLDAFGYWVDTTTLQSVPDEVHTPPPEKRG